MRLKIPARDNTPETDLFVDFVVKDRNSSSDRSVILFIPGGPGGNHTVYNAIRDSLFEYCDLLFFDPRGCGYSENSDPIFCTLENYIADIEAIRKSFNLEKIILMGGSYGAMAAVGYAVQYSSHIAKLILISGSPSFRFLETAKMNLKNQGTPEQIQIAENLWNGTFRDADHFFEFYRIMAPLYLFNKQKNANNLPTTKPNIPYNIAVTNLGFSDFLRKFDFEPELYKINCKTLILSGENDWINDKQHALKMSQLIPKNKLVIFEKCGHFIWEDQREMFLKTVLDFIAS